MSLSFFLLLTFTPAAFSAEPWTLTTADFHSDVVLLRGIDEHGIAVTTFASQNPHTVPLNDLLTLDRSAPLHTQPARFILRLSTGDRLAGDPVSFKGDSIVWHELLLGDITVSARSAVAIRRASAPESTVSAAARTEDVVTLNNGDTVHGVLSDLTAAAASVQPAAGGDATPVPLDSIASIEFATISSASQNSAGSPPTSSSADLPSPGNAFRISLADETALTARSLNSDEWTAHATLADASTRDLSTAMIQSIEQINGPIVWLSSLAPSENIQRPYIGPDHPARFDRSATGGLIRFADRTYSRGIGVHAYSKLTWPIDPSMKQFRTQYAIDGDLPYADVTVRVLLDGVVAHEKSGFRAGELSPVVTLDVTGKKSISLEADYGKNQDVQARLNWIEPALLRTARPEIPK